MMLQSACPPWRVSENLPRLRATTAESPTTATIAGGVGVDACKGSLLAFEPGAELGCRHAIRNRLQRLRIGLVAGRTLVH